MFKPDHYNHGITKPIEWGRYWCEFCEKFYDIHDTPMRVKVISKKPYKTATICSHHDNQI